MIGTVMIMMFVVLAMIFGYKIGREDGYEKGYCQAVSDLKFEFDEQGIANVENEL